MMLRGERGSRAPAVLHARVLSTACLSLEPMARPHFSRDFWLRRLAAAAPRAAGLHSGEGVRRRSTEPRSVLRFSVARRGCMLARRTFCANGPRVLSAGSARGGFALWLFEEGQCDGGRAMKRGSIARLDVTRNGGRPATAPKTGSGFPAVDLRGVVRVYHKAARVRRRPDPDGCLSVGYMYEHGRARGGESREPGDSSCIAKRACDGRIGRRLLRSRRTKYYDGPTACRRIAKKKKKRPAGSSDQGLPTERRLSRAASSPQLSEHKGARRLAARSANLMRRRCKKGKKARTGVSVRGHGSAATKPAPKSSPRTNDKCGGLFVLGLRVLEKSDHYELTTS